MSKKMIRFEHDLKTKETVRKNTVQLQRKKLRPGERAIKGRKFEAQGPAVRGHTKVEEDQGGEK